MTETALRINTDQMSVVSEMITGVAWTAALGAACRLRLIDVMEEIAEPTGIDAAKVAERAGAEPGAVHRLLRALSSRGLVDHVAGRRFQVNPLSASLRTEGPASVADILRAFEWSWEMWPHLTESVLSGSSVFPLLHGKSLFEYLAETPGEARMFDEAQNRNTELMVVPVVDALDLAEVRTVADVGGGRGALLREVLDRLPRSTGTLFDHASVVGEVDSTLCHGGRLADRVEIMPGDFLVDLPVRADLYLLKQVLHNWDDDHAVRILSAITESAPPNARIAVIEPLVGRGGPYEPVHAGMDLLMLLALGGKERTEEEYAALFARSGVDFVGSTMVEEGRIAIIDGRVRAHGSLPEVWPREVGNAGSEHVRSIS